MKKPWQVWQIQEKVILVNVRAFGINPDEFEFKEKNTDSDFGDSCKGVKVPRFNESRLSVGDRGALQRSPSDIPICGLDNCYTLWLI